MRCLVHNHRTDVMMTPARSTAADSLGNEVAIAADLLGNEVAVNRASTRNALEAHTKEVSHEPCCHRSRRQGIANLHSSTRRHDRRGTEGPDAKAHRARRTISGPASLNEIAAIICSRSVQTVARRPAGITPVRELPTACRRFAVLPEQRRQETSRSRRTNQRRWLAVLRCTPCGSETGGSLHGAWQQVGA